MDIYYSSTYSNPLGIIDSMSFLSANNGCCSDMPVGGCCEDTIIYNAQKYKKILQNIGSIKEKDVACFLTYLFLCDYVKRIDFLFDNEEDKQERIKNIQKMLECIKKNSCVVQKLPDICRRPSEAEDKYLDGSVYGGPYSPCISATINGNDEIAITIQSFIQQSVYGPVVVYGDIEDVTTDNVRHQTKIICKKGSVFNITANANTSTGSVFISYIDNGIEYYWDRANRRWSVLDIHNLPVFDNSLNVELIADEPMSYNVTFTN